MFLKVCEKNSSIPSKVSSSSPVLIYFGSSRASHLGRGRSSGCLRCEQRGHLKVMCCPSWEGWPQRQSGESVLPILLSHPLCGPLSVLSQVYAERAYLLFHVPNPGYVLQPFLMALVGALVPALVAHLGALQGSLFHDWISAL